MKHLILALVILLLSIETIYARDCWVNGYYRKDGTYVQGYWRSCPDSNRWNNYGRDNKSRKDSSSDLFSTPWKRDYDNDGIYNQFDMDDDNDGILDQFDKD